MAASDDNERLYEAFVKGSLSPLELQQLLEQLGDQRKAMVFKKAMLRALKQERFQGPVNDEVRKGVYESILSKIGHEDTYPDPVPRMRTGHLWWKVAAVIVVLMAVGAVLYKFRAPGNPANRAPVAAIDPIMPGGNKAVLTLANGQTLVLDSVTEGELATQGTAKVVKSAPGKLAYESEDSKNPADGRPVFNTLSTPRGGEYQLRLPDGSLVRLNAASSIRFPTSFSQEKRIVTITGEAYFEIAEDAQRPFVVRKGDMEIQVLGTSFDVNAYDDEPAIKVTLLEGKVRVASGPDQSAILRPGQQARIGRDIAVASDVSIDEAVAWKNGKFRFNVTGIQEVMRQIARWYDVEVEYKGNTTTRFWGSISRHVSIDKVLHMLEETGGVKFRVEGKTIVVLPG